MTERNPADDPIRVEATKLLLHVGHAIECVTYGSPPQNVSIECVSCYEIIHDEELYDDEPTFPPIPDDQRAREAAGAYNPVYREMTDDEVAAEELTWD